MNNLYLCAPNKYDFINDTCFSMDQLIEMAKAYNRFLTKNNLNPYLKSDQKINNVKLIQISNNKKNLLFQFKKIFSKVCGDDEKCIIKQKFMNEIIKEVRNDLDNFTFRPDGPINSTEWLKTTDINSILIQYENIYPNFKFLDAVPLNCEEYSFCSLYNFDFNIQAKKGIDYVATVYNHDILGQRGSHWVALFINIPQGEIYYCDSVGKKPFANILNMVDKYKKYYKSKYNKPVIYKFNKNRYQRDSSECGVYCCNFIIRKLYGQTFDDITQNPLNFKQINSCRNLYFYDKTRSKKPHAMCDPHIKLIH